MWTKAFWIRTCELLATVVIVTGGERITDSSFTWNKAGFAALGIASVKVTILTLGKAMGASMAAPADSPNLFK